ncbi:MAG: TIGR04211 family SH3 domain-containing protein [Desulfobacterales bacterium]
MKKTAILLASSVLLCLLVAASAAAETRYVNDLNEITLRTGPGLDYRINRMLVSGQDLEVIETSERWSKVRLSDGTTGWVFSKFLSDEKPDSLAVKGLREEIEPLREKIKRLEEENQRLITSNQELAATLEETQEKLQSAKEKYNALEEESESFLELKEQNETLGKELKEKEERIKILEQKISDAFFTSGLKWFLAGAGILILGIIFGRTSGSRKKRSSLL